jgi:ribonuclease R
LDDVKLMKRRKQRSDSVSAELTPAQVLALFERTDRALGWPALKKAAQAFRGHEADQLRRVLRGLCHTGDLYIDEKGRYHRAAPDDLVRGKLTLDPRNRLVLSRADEDDVSVRLSKGSVLRAGDEVEARITGGVALVRLVVARSQAPVIGRLMEGRHRWYVLSDTPGFKGRVYLEDHGDAMPGDAVAVRVVDEDSYGLVGVIDEHLARVDDEHVASTTLLRAYEVPTEWPRDVLDAAEGFADSVEPASHAQRRDLTKLPLVTIDGEDARDFDDAVFCEPRRAGGWRLVVAIADVAHYVKQGAPLDLEAEQRGNSVYLPDRVVPMLPETLSNGLCSLRPEEHRLALVCEMKISAKGAVSGYEFFEALIFSHARLTYTQVAAILGGDGSPPNETVGTSLQSLHAVYHALRDARDERGALDFDTRQLRLVLENGLLERIVSVRRNDAHRLIEEAMIAANVAAARFLEKAEKHAQYRVHEAPTETKLDQLRQALAFAGVRLGKSVPSVKELQAVVEGFGDRPDRWLLEVLVLRSMQQAVYSPENIGHYGLGLKRYMHFTSPIRRYADLVVHRAIKDVLRGQRKSEQRFERLLEIGEHISFTERRADDVSRDVEEWLKCEYIARWIGETFIGTVMGVTDFGLFIELGETYVTGLLHVSNLGDDFYHYYPESMSLVGERSGRRFRLGDELEVVLADVDVEGRKVDVLLPEGGRKKGGRRRR